MKVSGCGCTSLSQPPSFSFSLSPSQSPSLNNDKDLRHCRFLPVPVQEGSVYDEDDEEKLNDETNSCGYIEEKELETRIQKVYKGERGDIITHKTHRRRVERGERPR